MSEQNPTQTLASHNMKNRTNRPIGLLIMIVLVADMVVLGSHMVMGHTLTDFSGYGDSSEFLRVSEKFKPDGAHFPGYGWLLYLVNLMTFRFFNLVYLALGVNILLQIMGGILAFRIAQTYSLSERKALVIAILIVIFPFQNLFLTLVPLSDSFKLFLSLSIFYCYKTRREGFVIILTTILVSTRNAFVLSAVGLSMFFLYKRQYRLFLLSLMAYVLPVLFVVYQYLQRGDLLYYINVDRFYMRGEGEPGIIKLPFYFVVQLVRQSLAGHLALLYQLPYLLLILAYGYRLAKVRDYFALFFSGPIVFFLVSSDVRFAYSIISRYLAFCVPFIFPIYVDAVQKRYIFQNGFFRISFITFLLSMSLATLVYSLISFPGSNLYRYLSEIRLFLH